MRVVEQKSADCLAPCYFAAAVNGRKNLGQHLILPGGGLSPDGHERFREDPRTRDLGCRRS
jgi:hypothetical protein